MCLWERDGVNYRRAFDHDNYAVYMVERLSSEGANVMTEHLVRIDGQATVSIGEYNTARDRVIPRGRIDASDYTFIGLRTVITLTETAVVEA